MSKKDLEKSRSGDFIGKCVNYVSANTASVVFILVGLTLLGIGVVAFKDISFFKSSNVEVIEEGGEVEEDVLEEKIVVEIVGCVENPGVYEVGEGSRVNDLFVVSGGLSADADRVWVEKYVNRASKMADGQKIYIPSVDEQSNNESANDSGLYQSVTGVLGTDSGGLVNINAATLAELDGLPGIGPVYGQRIIDNRPYSIVDELVSKGALGQSVYEKIVDLICVY